MGVMTETRDTIVCHQISISYKSAQTDPTSTKLLALIREFYNDRVESLKIITVYHIFKPLSDDTLQAIANGPLSDPILESPVHSEDIKDEWDWIIEIGVKRGMTNSLAKTAQQAIEDFTGEPFLGNETVHTTTQYVLRGMLSEQEVYKIACELLGNTLIEDIAVKRVSTHISEGISNYQRQTSYENNASGKVQDIDIHISDELLLELSRQRQLALNLSEMQAIKQYYSSEQTKISRKAVGLSQNPTDVELEALAQTWSEHCKHKIFNAQIRYTEDEKTEIINSLFKTYIQKSTEEISQHINWLVSVFTDNAGIIRFNHKYNLAVKVETHNSPSALDPYGGALTGILGVNRDILGAGIGARLIANTNVLCFAPPDHQQALPIRIMHPKRMFEGVRKGIEHGGNKSGIPTVNGAIVFDERYLGKPLVYCGTVGIMPAVIRDEYTHIKEIVPGDLIVACGGRTGRDGIHGATFSSEELHADSPSSAVQIGDPFTQKKLQDFLLAARDRRLYRTLTDNGAGGFSSSVGELARLSGGCEIHLDQALLKHPRLLPWEILLSESQERMTLAVSAECLEELQSLADLHEVEMCTLGTFTDTEMFHVLFKEKTIAYLPLTFLHEGVPQQHLFAEWKTPRFTPLQVNEKTDYGSDLHSLLSRYNICSKERIIRQYDHEVQGGSVLKPLAGANQEGPGDAAIICPIELREGRDGIQEGICISNGICPRYSDIDAYHMAACALDEAIRNLVAVGCDPAFIAILDNFCWPDPIYDPVKTPDGKYKLAQLVRANKALYDYSKAFATPLISGKDSLKNDYKIGNVSISVPPTLLITAVGKIHRIENAVTSDAKCPGDLVYIIGKTKNELGCSEYACMKSFTGGLLPTVEANSAKRTYMAIHRATEQHLIASCHDCSDGGLAIALAEKAIGGELGMTINLGKVPVEGNLLDAEILFSETASRFVVTVNPKAQKAFEDNLRDCPHQCIGQVTSEKSLIIKGINGSVIVDEELSALKASWQRPLKHFPGGV